MRVFVHKNVVNSDYKPLTFQYRDLEQLKFDSAKLLGLKKCRRVFTGIGLEIKNILDIHENDHLFMSAGEEFFKQQDFNIQANRYSIALLGTGGVGKSAITWRYIRDIFLGGWDPTIEDFYQKTVEVHGRTCRLEILDTAGEQGFRHLRPQWMDGRDGFIFVYRVTEESDLETLNDFYEPFMQMGGNLPVILCGNRVDDLRGQNPKPRIAPEKIQELKQRFKAQVIETSALTGEHISELFETMVDLIDRHRHPPDASLCPCCCSVA